MFISTTGKSYYVLLLFWCLLYELSMSSVQLGFKCRLYILELEDDHSVDAEGQ